MRRKGNTRPSDQASIRVPSRTGGASTNQRLGPACHRTSERTDTTRQQPGGRQEPTTAKQQRDEPSDGRSTKTQDQTERPSERTNEGTDQPTNRPARQPPSNEGSTPPTPATPTTQESTHHPSKQPTHRRTNQPNNRPRVNGGRRITS